MAKRFPVEFYAERILAHDRLGLSRAITLVESTLPSDRELAHQVMQQILPFAGNSVRIGITGVPGVGKSTFIETFGNYVTNTLGKKLAVLAIDPTSQKTGGSILGDKTRMETLAGNPMAYIRPSPAGKSLGGVTRSTRESIMLCEAAGFEVIFVETVGVGQSETAVNEMVDFFLLLMLAGAGDELQGIKKGIMEMADAVVITKADGQNLQKARVARAEFQSALHLFPRSASGWIPKVSISSALENTGIPEIWKTIEAYLETVRNGSFFEQKRQNQNLHWLHETIRQTLLDRFFAKPEVLKTLPELEQKVLHGEVSAFAAAEEILKLN
ncbi:methylmalonyl Co-A mutase-associated GTPase MeaB [Adhaeribacter sp. BT258]|uniref:Methylmalonyl Co-A mutase-associated GTPase MeaB n=1 Tax=Adhaeribacter terrigena TaxID=2793070 RepID=A0ABS1BXU7_9BACT|nr:methylmalonyl Co-A mutase-associated GTPase MeaB [Adhaeribacter terrigena]MBK0401959.1 methylmalonyl Co-A mutase-associated GTPase MeaB [Adhaeribacter terrigena]